MPIQSLPETFSPKNTSAIIVVATISKLFSSDTLSALEQESPNISATGAATSSKIIASV